MLASAAWLSGAAVAAPVAGTDPSELPAVTLEQDYAATTVLTIGNTGDATLDYDIRIQEYAPAAVAPSGDGYMTGSSPNDWFPTTDPTLTPQATYSGDHLYFGITEYGEIMPYQYPIGNEHLRNGAYYAGYTLYYRAGTNEYTHWAIYGSRNGIRPVSYEELENSATRTRVRVRTETADGWFYITRTFDFRKDSKAIEIATEITNRKGFGIADVTFKELADWDLDGSASGDTFDYDEEFNLAYAYQSVFAGIASNRTPLYHDLNGWDDWNRKATDQDLLDGPVTFDGLPVLHFDFGRLAGGESQSLTTYFATGDSLEELQEAIGITKWLTAEPREGSVGAGGSQAIDLNYDALGLAPGTYNTNVYVRSNDPANPIIALPAVLTVTPDATPPATLTDLTVVETGSGSVRLEWTAVGDTGLGGPPAAGYDIRYSTAPIDDSTWDSATQVSGEPLPGEPGVIESMTITGLDPSTEYFFAIRVSDDAALTSGLATASTTTLLGPGLSTAPATLPHQTLEQDGLTTQVVTISNTGDESLTFNIDVESTAEPAAIVPEPYGAEIPVLELADDEVDPRIGPPVIAGTGGPDLFGYRWADSDEDGGPTFDWIDIAATGTVVEGLGGDNRVGPFPIGFDFSYYGDPKTQFWIHDNGMITFDGTYRTLVNQPIPRTDSANGMIAWFWENLSPAGDAVVRYQVLDGNKLVIQFNDYSNAGTLAGDFDAQVILYQNGNIKVQYGEFRGFTLTNNATVGIENSSGTDGLMVAFNTEYIEPYKAILFRASPSWLDPESYSGSVPPGGSSLITMTYSAVDQAVGEYTGNVVINSNAVSDPTATIPASLTVTPDATPPGAITDLGITDVTFDSLTLNWTAVADNGVTGKPATAYDIRYSSSAITPANWDSATQLAGEPSPATPGSPQSMLLTGLAPSAPMHFAMRVSDDGGLLSGLSNNASTTLLDPPVAVADPTEIDVSLPEGQTTEETVTISNGGPYPLDYSVSLVDMSAAPIALPPATPTPDWDLEATISSMSTEEFVPGELIVRYAAGTSYTARASAAGSAAETVVRAIPELDMEVWALEEGVDMEATLRALADDPSIALAEPNYIVYADALTNDPRLEQLYGMHNTGQTGGTPDADIDAPEAWDVITGDRSVVVAIIDTGIDYNHEDLAANMWINEDEIVGNGIDDDGNGYVDDIYGYDFAYNDGNPMDGHYHGTHVAGTVGGVGDNGIGVVGVTQEVRLMAVKFLNDGGSGSTADAIEAVLYAVDNGAQILNNSWGGGSFSAALQDAIEYANSNDVLFVASAGNDGRNTDGSPKYPSTYPNENILSVAATDHNDLKAGFSNYGLATVDLGAPGVNTISASPGNSYRSLSGTSMAAPHVSGAAALLKAFNSSLTALELKAILMESGDPVASMAGRTVSGNRLNIAAALELAGPDWVSISGEMAGRLAAGESAVVTVALDAVEKELGLHLASLNVVSNDPVNPSLEVPIQLTVTPDCCAPATIDDLVITERAWNAIEVNWTAVGDDGLIGKAEEYDVRYSDAPITAENWGSATQVDNEPQPGAAGTLEVLRVAGLDPDTPYWIAVKAIDNSAQVSGLSNVVTGSTVNPPTISTDPATMPHVVLGPAGSDDTRATETMTVANSGSLPLEFRVRIANAATPPLPVDLSDPVSVPDPTANDSAPTPPPVTPAATYTGDVMSFGISSYGEIMPFKFPLTKEHLLYGSYYAGYTLSYRTGTDVRVKWSGYGTRSGIVPVSYEELENSAERVLVRVITRTDDSMLLVERTIEFAKDEQRINISTTVRNNKGYGIADVVYKEFADWDMDGSSSGDTFVYDEALNLAAAWQVNYAGIASNRAPDFRDLRGWDDYQRKITNEEYPTGPVSTDGLVILHFELGRLLAGSTDTVDTIYAAAASMDGLREQISFARWLTSDTDSGTVEPGESQEITLTYDSSELDFGDYAAAVQIDSNDPQNPLVTIPATLTVNSPPVAQAGGPYVTTEGSSVTFNGSGSSDADGDELEYRWDINGDGRWESGWSTDPTFEFALPMDMTTTTVLEVRDPYGETATDETSLTVSNLPPVADRIVLFTIEDLATPLTLSGYDPGYWDRLTYDITAMPSHGVITGTPPEITYTPDADFSGSDSFVFVINDGVASSAPATVSITVLAINDPPTAAPDSAATSEDTPVSIDVIANDIDPDNSNAELSVAAGSVVGINGSAVLQPDGRTILFTPATNLNNENTPGGFSVTYRTTDGLLTSPTAGVVTVSVSAVNDPPVFSATAPPQRYVDQGSAMQSINVIATDVDSPTLYLQMDGNPAGSGIETAKAGCTFDADDYIGASSVPDEGVACTWTLGGVVTAPVGTYTTSYTVTDSLGGSDMTVGDIIVRAP